MESGVQSSFIPHDAGDTQRSPRVGGGGLSDLLLVLSIVALAASAALAGAVFLYQQYLQTTVTSKVQQLTRAKEQVEPALVQKLTRLDDRMHTAQALLNAHIAPSAFFTILNQVTLKTVAYNSLQFDAIDARHIAIKMDGVARSVNSIALQADLFSQSGVFTSPLFSGINRQKDGVHFNVAAQINPTALNFVQLTSGGASLQQALPVEQTPQTASSTQSADQSSAVPQP